MAKVSVIQGGMLTTIQDQGRTGYQQYGIPSSGVMDEYSYALANALVGNQRGEAVLEITYMGPMLSFEEDVIIAITGANLSPMVDGLPLSMYESHKVKAGSTLSFGRVMEGVRAYLAFAGEMDVPIVSGSKSTFIKSKIGGYEGRALKAGDEFLVRLNPLATAGNVLPEQFVPKFEKSVKIRAIPGPQHQFFTEKGIQIFFSEEGYLLSQHVDRMGIRLEGEPIEHKEGVDIVSDATVLGNVQVPSDGRPIILMADRQTTGGYTKIATVIREDIAKLAQLGPGDHVVFQKISLEEAQKRYREYEERLQRIFQSLK